MNGYWPEKLICLIRGHRWECCPNEGKRKICRRCREKVYDENCSANYSLRRLLTKDDDQSYEDYIAGICSGIVAPIVKLADLWHNLRPERMALLAPEQSHRLERRYLNARNVIWAVEGHNWWPEAPHLVASPPSKSKELGDA